MVEQQLCVARVAADVVAGDASAAAAGGFAVWQQDRTSVSVDGTTIRTSAGRQTKIAKKRDFIVGSVIALFVARKRWSRASGAGTIAARPENGPDF